MYDNIALKSKEVTLFEVLDRILDKGIVIKGNLTISVADVDLIYIGLQAIITSVDRFMGMSDISGQQSAMDRYAERQSIVED
jgi:hypothetical protein